MKDLDKTKFWLGLKLEQLPTVILMYQSVYVQKNIEKFNMNKVYPFKTRMVIRAFEKKTDLFRPHQEG
jgi:hypothetical protein